jgi:hypothetical protein
VEVTITVDERGSSECLASLYQWLARDPELRDVGLRPVSEALSPGDMGLDMAAINAILANVMAAGSLVVSIATWRESRRAAPAVQVKAGEVIASLTNDTQQERDSATQAIQAIVDGSQSPTR